MERIITDKHLATFVNCVKLFKKFALSQNCPVRECSVKFLFQNLSKFRFSWYCVWERSG